MEDRHQRHRRRPADPRRRPVDGFRALSSDQFQRLVDRAARAIPLELISLLDNVVVVVEDVPAANVLGEGDEVLLGLYEGVPRTARSDAAPVLPDRITLYRRPIEARARTLHELTAVVRDTLIHEIAHHFGIDDDHLDDLGY